MLKKINIDLIKGEFRMHFNQFLVAPPSPNLIILTPKVKEKSESALANLLNFLLYMRYLRVLIVCFQES